MATYLELFALRSDSDLQDRVLVATAKKAQSLLDKASPTINEVAWASDAINNPKSKADALLNYVLVKNSAATPVQITGASDATLQGVIDAAVDVIISGGV